MLTSSQKKALHAVADGKVKCIEPLRISRPSRIEGCRADVIRRLQDKGLVTTTRITPFVYKYILTRAGCVALEEK